MLCKFFHSFSMYISFSFDEMIKYMRRTAGYTWTDYKTNTQITKELKITPILDKLVEYKRNWIQRVNRMPLNRLSRVIKHYSPTGRRNYGRPLKRLLYTWDRNGSTSGPTPWQMYDDDDVDDDDDDDGIKFPPDQLTQLSSRKYLGLNNICFINLTFM